VGVAFGKGATALTVKLRVQGLRLGFRVCTSAGVALGKGATALTVKLRVQGLGSKVRGLRSKCWH
jgi:hypothetical protein